MHSTKECLQAIEDFNQSSIPKKETHDLRKDFLRLQSYLLNAETDHCMTFVRSRLRTLDNLIFKVWPMTLTENHLCQLHTSLLDLMITIYMDHDYKQFEYNMETEGKLHSRAYNLGFKL
jgi:hypothetical protein